jgi:hypothetical protein
MEVFNMKLVHFSELKYERHQPANSQGVTFKLNRSNLTLGLFKHGHWYYEIDLERCRNSSELLDWILQVATKDNPDFFTPTITGDLIAALEDTAYEVFGTNLQGLYCPFGQGRAVDWKAALKR